MSDEASLSPGSRSSLRAHLAFVIFIATVPLAVLSFMLIAREMSNQQQQLEQGLQDLANSQALVVSGEIAATVDALRILAHSPALAQQDLTAFHHYLQTLPEVRPSWGSVYLATPDGRILLSSAQPLGAALGSLTLVATTAQPLAPIVLDVQPAPNSGRLVTGVQVPVVQQGGVGFHLGAWIPVDNWQRLLVPAAGVDTGFLSIFDGQLRFVARSGDGAAHAGHPLPGDAPEKVGREPSGVYRGPTVDGGEAYVAWQRIGWGDWGVGVGTPAEPVDAAKQSGLVTAAAGGLLSLTIGMALAWLVALRVTVPLQRLAASGAANRLGRISIREIAQLRDALSSLELQRRSAIERLSATADELQAVFSSTTIGLAIAQDPEGRTVRRNDALRAMLGAHGQDDEGVVSVRHNGRALGPDEQPLQRAASTGQPIENQELTLTHPDGRELKVLVHAVPLRTVRGEVRGAVAGFVDITQRVQAESRIVVAERRLRESRQMIELAQQAGRVGFFDFNFKTRTVRGTAGLAELLDAPAALFEQPWTDWLGHVHPEDAPSVEQAIADGIAQNAGEIRFEFRNRDPVSEARWLSGRCVLIFNEGDERQRPAHLIGVVMDVTEQKLVERERAEHLERQQTARLAAESANRAKDEFLAMLGHELRNPLGAIASAAEVLNRAPAPELAERARIIIQRQTRHLARLMDDLLDVTRVISGKIALSRQPLDLAHSVDRAVTTLELSGAMAQHDVKVDLEPVWVSADATRAEQIVNNLLSNALKYTPPGGKLRISTRRDGDDAVLEVSDTGVGMSEALVPVVFDLFVQGERSLDRRQGGLGVGLTLVRRLVEMHGGSVQACSEGPNQGSRFIVRLPTSEEWQGSESGPFAPLSQARTIAVVEDNDDARDALKTMLEMDGWRVQTAQNGREGLALILDMRPDFALVDIGLPELSGLEVAAEVRKAGVPVRLIAVSGYGQASDVQQALAAGFDGHVVKPIDPHELAKRLA